MLRSKLVHLVWEFWLVVVGFVALWFATENSTSLFFPPLRTILHRSKELWLGHQFSVDVVPSLEHLAVGWVIAVALGLAIGIVIGSTPRLADALNPLLRFGRSLPGIVLVPVFLLVFGIGATMQIGFITYGATWPVLLNTVEGVHSVDTTLRDVARVYGLSRTRRLLSVVLPSASPQIIAGVRLSLSLGIVLIVSSEMFASTDGLGHFILNAQQTFAVTDMWSGVILLGIIGYVLNLMFRVVEYSVLGWHHKRRKTLEANR